MPDYNAQELDEALRAINSIIHKCEKAQEKFPEGNAHHTLLRNRLKAMHISKALITEALAKKPRQAEDVSTLSTGSAERAANAEQLLASLKLLHTTELGAGRIKQNLHLHTEDIVGWCAQMIQDEGSIITRRGKNWYISLHGCEITVNAHSYTIITAHKRG